MPVSQVYLPNSVELLIDVMNFSHVNLNKCLFIPHRAPMTHQVKITTKAWTRCYLQKHGWFKAVAFPRSPLQHRWFLPHSSINGVFASVNFSHLCISQDQKLMWSLAGTVYTFEGGANPFSFLRDNQGAWSWGSSLSEIIMTELMKIVPALLFRGQSSTALV